MSQSPTGSKYSFKLATPDDWPSVFRMVHAFASNLLPDREPSTSRLNERVDWFLSGGSDRTMILLLHELEGPVGLLAGMKVPHLFSEQELAIEQVWWVDPEHRNTRYSLMLIGLFEEWAKRTNCNQVVMGGLDGSTNVSKLYTRLGFKLAEYSFTKDI
jgi:GNAT superfamily N-acetyltransferase